MIGGTVAEEIDVAGFASAAGDPQSDQHAALKDEAIVLVRNRQAMEQPLKGIRTRTTS